MLIDEDKLDDWVRSHKEAQQVIVELIWRLVSVSCPKPEKRRFPLSINQHGWDGFLITQKSYDPFVPIGTSYWEIGTGKNARKKANLDYNKLTKEIPLVDRVESTFIFVTPLSGEKGWEHSRKSYGQKTWLDDRKKENNWKDVRIIDGAGLVDWLSQFPAIQSWLARKMGLNIDNIEAIDSYWNMINATPNGIMLTAEIFLLGREHAIRKLNEVLIEPKCLKLETNYPEQIPSFVAAYLKSLNEDDFIEITGRCVIVSSSDAWNQLCEQYEAFILVPTPTAGLSDIGGALLINKARLAGHSIIYRVPPGSNDENSTLLPQPDVFQLSQALKRAGFNEIQGLRLANKCAGNLTSLLRILQELPLVIESIQNNEYDFLVTAMLIGRWDERNESDLDVIKLISEKPYETLIETLHEIANRCGTPIICQDGKWNFFARYQGWFVLGPYVYDKSLDKFRKAIVTVLKEKNPKFDLPKDERYAAQIYGKRTKYSMQIHKGLAESLALLGTQKNTLIHCSFIKPEQVAILSVRDIFKDADWVTWASLGDELPFLAEAAPNEFLDAIESGLRAIPCPFDELFAQESSGIFGATYTSGLLWSLETLAWDSDLFVRTISVLGDLAARDPGGNWGNRPSNSLTAIFLPWLPQTCAPIKKRSAAINIILQEHPDVAWKLLLSLLPNSHNVSDFTRRPVWRDTIPDNWSMGVTRAELYDQSVEYAQIAFNAAKTNVLWLVDLVERIVNIPKPVREQLLSFLVTDDILNLPESDRCQLWTALVNLVVEHRKFSDADWTMKSQQIDEIETIARKLTPISSRFLYKRLFINSDLELYREKHNFDDQGRLLNEERREAVGKILDELGVQGTIDFAYSVQSPWKVGYALGFIEKANLDNSIVPEMLESETVAAVQFANGYICGRFQNKQWSWIDTLVMEKWTKVQIAKFFAQLPFEQETWERASNILGCEESQYWSIANAYPNNASEDTIGFAVDKLIKFGRPGAAIDCLFVVFNNSKKLDNSRAIAALFTLVNSPEILTRMDYHEIIQIIMKLQDDPQTDQEALFMIEWAYLPFIDMEEGIHPSLLEKRLVNDPEFFCEVIRHIYPSKNEGHPPDEQSEVVRNVAKNCYRLLHGWKTPPGSLENGGFDGMALDNWLKVVKKKCSETGHLEVALIYLGNVLAYSPPDPNGLWIHKSIALVLNDIDAETIREGYSTELFNSREAHTRWVDSGAEPEKELVIKYRKQADEVEMAGFHRLATKLRELAEEYNHEAERITTRGLINLD